MIRLNRTLCAVTLTVAISTSVFAGNIGGMRTTSAGNIGGMRTTAVGNIGGTRTGNIGGTRTNSPIDLSNGTPGTEFPISGTLITLFRLLVENPLF